MKNLFLSLLVLLLAGGCKKDKDPKPDLPPETHEGKNTFACRVNGRPWNHGIKNGLSPMIQPLEVAIGGGEFFVLANLRKDGEPPSAIVFYLSNVYALGDYPLNFSTPRQGEVYYQDDVTGAVYPPDSLKPSALTVTYYDLSKRIIAGRFYFTGVGSPGDTLRITDGRFDLKF